MVLLLLVANLVLLQYTVAATRGAAAAGARRGAVLAATTHDCELAARRVLRGEAGLLRGAVGNTVQTRCWVQGDRLRVSVVARVPWFWGGGETVVEALESRIRERAP
jgi:hypothetical protein